MRDHGVELQALFYLTGRPRAACKESANLCADLMVIGARSGTIPGRAMALRWAETFTDLHSGMPSLDRVARAQTKRVNIRRASLSVPLVARANAHAPERIYHEEYR